MGGGTNWDVIGRKEPPKGSKAPPKGRSTANLWGPHVWRENIRVRTVGSSCVACHSGLVTEDGKVYTWGRNESGQVNRLFEYDKTQRPVFNVLFFGSIAGSWRHRYKI